MSCLWNICFPHSAPICLTQPRCLQASMFTHANENRNHSTPKITTFQVDRYQTVLFRNHHTQRIPYISFVVLHKPRPVPSVFSLMVAKLPRPIITIDLFRCRHGRTSRRRAQRQIFHYHMRGLPKRDWKGHPGVILEITVLQSGIYGTSLLGEDLLLRPVLALYYWIEFCRVCM